MIVEAGLLGLAVTLLTAGRTKPPGATCAVCDEELVRTPTAFVHQREGTMERWLPNGQIDHVATPLIKQS